MADGCMATRSAFEEVFPDSIITMCFYHVLKNAKRKIGRCQHSLGVKYFEYWYHSNNIALKCPFSAALKAKDAAVAENILKDIQTLHHFAVDNESFMVMWALL